MGKLYLKMMVSLEVNGEVYFPMTKYNNKLYKLKNDGYEINVDGAFDGEIIKLIPLSAT